MKKSFFGPALMVIIFIGLPFVGREHFGQPRQDKVQKKQSSTYFNTKYRDNAAR